MADLTLLVRSTCAAAEPAGFRWPAWQESGMAVTSREDLWREGERLAGSAGLAARSGMESGVIASLIAERGLDCYIDVGCWYGFLLRRVMERARGKLRRVLAVDAVPEFVAFARGQVEGLGPEVEFRTAVLTPRSAEPRVMRIDMQDTSKSGLEVDAGGGIEVAESPRCGIAEVLEDVGREHVANSYLKIDAEGCDEALVVELLGAGYRPGVVHFEVLREGFASSPALAELARCGYRIPRAAAKHPYYSIACSAGDPVVIGFRPDVVYRAADLACA